MEFCPGGWEFIRVLKTGDQHLCPQNRCSTLTRKDGASGEALSSCPHVVASPHEQLLNEDEGTC